jgi:hypothetical protein
MHGVVIQILQIADPILIGMALFFLLRQKLAKRYPSFVSFLGFRLVSVPFLYFLLSLPARYYKYYFSAYWFSAAIEAGLTLWCVGQMFSISLSPLRGIRKLAAGTFGCMCAISLIVAAAMSISSSLNGPRFLMELVSQMVRFESLLVLCLLVFLAFASHMLGLSYRSRIFSVSFGFGITAAASLFSSALMSKTAMDSRVEMIVACVSSLPLVIWNLAMALPEPARRLITVPVDSWMLRWNDIAKSFGHGPAAVVVGEDPLQMMHPNEVLMHQHVMSRKAPAGAIAHVSRG